MYGRETPKNSSDYSSIRESLNLSTSGDISTDTKNYHILFVKRPTGETKSLLNGPFEHNFWTALLDITSGRSFRTSLLDVTFEYHI